jgi:hypothetical protein
VSPLVRLLGWEHEAPAAHVELARQGFTFMLIYVPPDLDTDPAEAVARPTGRRRRQPPALPREPPAPRRSAWT